jgi:ribonucleotide reductase alpha subunit
MQSYEQFIHKSRYARYLESEQRREKWPETINRYLDFIQNHLVVNYGYVLEEDLRLRLFEAIYSASIMPSMRSMMTAGDALERDNTAGYNCSYLPIDDIKAFDEAMFILLCGTGVGFSVERQYINKLPEVPKLHSSNTKIDVEDSKEGWAYGLRQLIALLYSGQIAKWDTSKVRPAGARLKTFGGRASGPGPLVELFKFVIDIFKATQGRRLTSIECHDIMCKIGEVVVVGGVRRSAMISLSNLSDDRMRHAKSGAWWDIAPHRALANNSVCYTEKPDVGSFMREWLALYDSKSGERGIFNRQAANKIVELNNRRDPNYDFGTNPCCVLGSTYILTDKGQLPIIETVGKETSIWNGYEFSKVVPYEAGVADIYRVFLSNGSYLDCTSNHRFALHAGWSGKKQHISMVETHSLNIGDKLAKFSFPVIKEGEGYLPVDAYSQGFYSGDGNTNLTHSWLYEPKYACSNRLVGEILQEHNAVARKTWKHGPMLDKGFVPINYSLPIVLDWLAGLFDADGTVTRDKNGDGIQLSSINKDFLNNVRLLLNRLGVSSKIQLMLAEGTADFNDGYGEYDTKDCWRLLVGNMATYQLQQLGLHCERLNLRNQPPNRDAARFITVTKVEYLNYNTMTYCFTEPKKGLGTFNGIVTGNSEIILRPYQFCNLSEIVVRAEDTIEDLVEKAELATILGTFQATLTDFPYLRDIWRKNTEEERLLGVSMTGIMDNAITNGKSDYLPEVLETLKAVCVSTNNSLAKEIGIPPSAAITCVKPSGTVSQLTDSASGIHARHAKYYYRRIRGDVKDPLTQFMIKQGIPNEPCVMKPEQTVVFTFPKKAPTTGTIRDDLGALKHLELWLLYQKHWCEHKPSVTINVRESEWPEVGAFVWDNFDWMSGVSFLPYDGGSYRQAPYEECTEEEYLALSEKIPTTLDWDSIIETEDDTEGAQTLACSSGFCEI